MFPNGRVISSSGRFLYEETEKLKRIHPGNYVICVFLNSRRGIGLGFGCLHP